jgi:hypothetical protein
MKKTLILIALFVTLFSFSQNLNQYKYAIVPSKFTFLSLKNEYNLNDLTNAALRKYGFEPIYDTDQFPNDISDKNKLFVAVQVESSFVYLKMKIVLKDSKNNILFTTKEAKTKEKNYDNAYNELLRETVNSFETLNHHYQESENEEKLQENGIYIADSKLVASNLLVAETIENGFLIIDPISTTIVLKLYKTSDKSIFIAKSNQNNGVVIKKESGNYFEYYKDNQLISEKLNVSF